MKVKNNSTIARHIPAKDIGRITSCVDFLIGLYQFSSLLEKGQNRRSSSQSINFTSVRNFDVTTFLNIHFFREETRNDASSF